MFLDSAEIAELEPAPTDYTDTKVIEADSIETENTPSLLPYILGGAVLGYLALKI